MGVDVPEMSLSGPLGSGECSEDSSSGLAVSHASHRSACGDQPLQWRIKVWSGRPCIGDVAERTTGLGRLLTGLSERTGGISCHSSLAIWTPATTVADKGIGRMSMCWRCRWADHWAQEIPKRSQRSDWGYVMALVAGHVGVRHYSG